MNSYSPSGYKHAANVYKANSNEGLSEREMMAKLHQKIINQLYLARDAYLAGNIEGMLEYNYKVIHIADVLRNEMLATSESLAQNDPEASTAIKFHATIYLQLLERIANVLLKKPPEEEFNALIEFVKPLYEAWLPEKPATQAEAAADTAPQAGNITNQG